MKRKIRGASNSKGNTVPSRADLIVKNAKTHFNPSTFVTQNYPKFDVDNGTLEISCQPRSRMDAETLNWALNLTEVNMKDLYDASEWGWKRDEKREELEDADAIYLLARDTDKQPQGFVHFRFDTDFGKAVIYCYEIQLEEPFRRKGLGRFFMDVLLKMAFEIKMAKVVLTVLKTNVAAVNFYTQKLDFKIDDTSPSVSIKEDVCYEILSKRATN